MHRGKIKQLLLPVGRFFLAPFRHTRFAIDYKLVAKFI